MYKGQLEGFPKPIVDRMLLRQEEAGNPKDVTVFEKKRFIDIFSGGFDWDLTSEDWEFWYQVISEKRFEVYFKKYPEEKPIIKTSVHDLTDKEVIHCTTKEESDAIRELLDEEGFKWSDGASYLTDDPWRRIDSCKNICYNVKKGEWCSPEYYLEEGYILYPAYNFLNSKANLDKKDEVLEKSSKELKYIDPPKGVKVVWLRTKRTIKHGIITLPEGYVTWETEDYFNVEGNNTCIIENNRFHVNWNKEDFEVISDPRETVIPGFKDPNKCFIIDGDNWTWGYPSDQVCNIPNIKIPKQMFDPPSTPDECYLSEFVQPQEVKTILKRKSKTIKL